MLCTDRHIRLSYTLAEGLISCCISSSMTSCIGLYQRNLSDMHEVGWELLSEKQWTFQSLIFWTEIKSSRCSIDSLYASNANFGQFSPALVHLQVRRHIIEAKQNAADGEATIALLRIRSIITRCGVISCMNVIPSQRPFLLRMRPEHAFTSVRCSLCSHQTMNSSLNFLSMYSAVKL